MIRVLLFFAFVALLALGISWFADVPGTVTVDLPNQGMEIQIDVFYVVIALVLIVPILILLWTAIVQLVSTPAVLSNFMQKRKESRGLTALSNGIIAVSSGDRSAADRFAHSARKALPNEPLTALLRAQSAQLTGDRALARRIYEGMLSTPDTELLGLRGLFLEAQKENEDIAAQQFAERAMRLNPKLSWSVNALFSAQCRDQNWDEAEKTLDVGKLHGHFSKPETNRKRAILLTAQATDCDTRGEIDRAVELASQAHKLAPDLVPAAEIAGRLLASKGNTSKAAKTITKTWKLSPHPDLAYAYAYARPGDSPKDRLKRVQSLAYTTPHNAEGPIAVALAAIEALDWETARTSLKRLAEGSPTARVCTLMARIEAGEFGDQGRVREWLARALKAPKDPTWTADGYTSDHWLPVSPITGELDAFAWKVPVESIGADDTDIAIEDFMAMETIPQGMLAGGSIETSSDKQSELPKQDEVEETEEIADDIIAAEPVEKTDPGNSEDKEPVAKADDKTADKADDIVAAESSSTAGRVPDTLTEEEKESDKDKPVDGPEAEIQEPVSATDGKAAEILIPEPESEDVSGQSTKEAKSDSVEEKPEITAVPEEKDLDQKPQAVADVRPRNSDQKKPKIFVPPRAPDDPGPEPLDPDEAQTPLARYRTGPAKA